MSDIEKVKAQIAGYSDDVLLRIRAQASNGVKARAAEWNPHLVSINRTRAEQEKARITATKAQELSRAIVYLIDEEIARRGLK